jgi:hypothetical protein
MMNEQRQRNRIAPLTAVRAYRLERGITLAEVALESGLTTFRLSLVERDPSKARDGEIAAHRAAVDSIATKRSDAA